MTAQAADPTTYRVVVRLPIPVAAFTRIADAFPGSWLLTEHDEGDGVMVLDVPWEPQP